MPKTKKKQKPLSAQDFAGDGEPYTEAEVRISIRILGKGITRSRLAVNVYPDPALERFAKESLRELKIDTYGVNEESVFGACLSEHFNGWEDLDHSYPRMDEKSGSAYENECAANMNSYIKKSVEWALELHKKGMAEALLNDSKLPGDARIQ